MRAGEEQGQTPEATVQANDAGLFGEEPAEEPVQEEPLAAEAKDPEAERLAGDAIESTCVSGSPCNRRQPATFIRPTPCARRMSVFLLSARRSESRRHAVISMSWRTWLALP